MGVGCASCLRSNPRLQHFFEPWLVTLQAALCLIILTTCKHLVAPESKKTFAAAGVSANLVSWLRTAVCGPSPAISRWAVEFQNLAHAYALLDLT